MMQNVGHFFHLFTNKNLLTVILSMLILFKPCQGGTCWLRVQDSGRCLGLLEMGIDRDDCCRSGSVNAGWTEQNEYSEGRIFYLEYLAGGAPQCYPCHQTCENVQCIESDRRCRVKDGRARCVCAPDCSNHDDRHRGHLCGNDGNTYKNYCTLLKMNCRRERNVQVDYFGRCRYSCDHVHCSNGDNCVEDQNGIPHCIPCRIEEVCPPSQPYENLCGADGNNYASVCQFRKATCLNGRSIGIAYRGECDSSLSCSTLRCPQGKKCLVNQLTGGPQCVMCGDSCTSQTVSNPICGTDGNTYTSWCSMQRVACRRGVVITTEHYGPCDLDGPYGDYPAQGDDYEAYYDLP